MKHIRRTSKNEKPEAQNEVEAVRSWLFQHGFRPKATEVKGGSGLRIGEKLVRVKSARFSNGGWTYNFHVHNRLDESGVNAYILRLGPMPGNRAASHLIIAAPIGLKGIFISPRSLMVRWSKHFNDFSVLAERG